jgi:predicted flap endonuclease-1-like 5' DNA nuclease
LRAFTAADRKAIKQTAENYPISTFYKTEDALTQLGIGEAFITTLNEKGVPTPLVHTLLCPPRSRMDILTEGEIDNIVSKSRLISKYNTVVDSQSAYEILNEKLKQAEEQTQKAKEQEKEAKETKTTTKKEKGFFDDPIVKSMTRTAGNTIIRGLLGSLGLGGRSRRSLF